MTANTRLIKENIRIAFSSITSHLLRTILTVLIIAFGIMALVGILTAIDAVEASLSENFAMMGSNTFNIQNRGLRVHIGGKRSNPVDYRVISFEEAMDFKEQLDKKDVQLNVKDSQISDLSERMHELNAILLNKDKKVIDHKPDENLGVFSKVLVKFGL